MTTLTRNPAPAAAAQSAPKAYRAPAITKPAAALARAWYSGCAVAFRTREMAFLFRPAFPVPAPGGDVLRLRLKIGEDVGFVDLPETLIGKVLRRWNMSSSSVSERSLLLVIEYVCDALLSAVEKASAAPVTCDAISRRTPGYEAPELFGFCDFGDETWPIGISLPASRAAELAAALKRAAAPAGLGGLGVEMAFRLGATRVTAKALRRVKAGDAILADHMLAGDALVAVAGERLIARAIRQGRQVTLTAKAAPMTRADEEAWRMTDGGSDPNWARPDADASFDDIQIKLLFEFARTEIRLDELQKLGPGYVFDFSKTPKAAIDIYAGSRRIGHGEVVQVGDALAVRVTRLFNNE